MCDADRVRQFYIGIVMNIYRILKFLDEWWFQGSLLIKQGFVDKGPNFNVETTWLNTWKNKQKIFIILICKHFQQREVWGAISEDYVVSKLRNSSEQGKLFVLNMWGR